MCDVGIFRPKVSNYRSLSPLPLMWEQNYEIVAVTNSGWVYSRIAGMSYCESDFASCACFSISFR